MKTSRLAATVTTAATALALSVSLLATTPAAAAETTVTVTATQDADQRAQEVTGTPADRRVLKRKGQSISAPKQVAVGSKFTVTGKVSIARKKKRTVGVFEAKGRKWRLLTKKKTSKKGTFTFTLNAGSKIGERRLAVAASRSKGVKGFEKHFAVKVVKASELPPPPPVEVPTTAVAGLDKPTTPLYGAPITVTGAVGGEAPRRAPTAPTPSPCPPTSCGPATSAPSSPRSPARPPRTPVSRPVP